MTGRTYKTERLSRELNALKNADGMIVPTDVVAWAERHTRSALHAEIEWDDAVAGPKWRLQQVRMLIAVHVVDPEGHRQFVSLSIDRSAGGGYRSVADVISKVDLREVMLNDALEDLNRMQQKYQWLQELAAVWAAAAEVEKTMRKRRTGRKKAA